MNDKGKGFESVSRRGELCIESLQQLQWFVEQNGASRRWFRDASLFGTRFLGKGIYGGKYICYSIKNGVNSYRNYCIAEVRDSGFIYSTHCIYGAIDGNNKARREIVREVQRLVKEREMLMGEANATAR